MNQITDTSPLSLLAFEEGFDPIEDRLRANIRSAIESVFEEELDSFPGRLRYSRHGGGLCGSGDVVRSVCCNRPGSERDRSCSERIGG